MFTMECVCLSPPLILILPRLQLSLTDSQLPQSLGPSVHLQGLWGKGQ